MGSYLTEPSKEVTFDFQENQSFLYGISQMQGWRTTMEDSYKAQFEIQKDIHLFGVFDGHGGKSREVAQFVSNHFVELLIQNEKFKQAAYDISLEETFLKLDEMLKEEKFQEELKNLKVHCEKEQDKENYGMFTGCTAVVALIVRKELYIANAGDCRCILQREDETIELSEDHLPHNQGEAERIVNAGGFIDKTGRLNSTLAISRAIGDLEFKQNPSLSVDKQLLISFPEVRKIKLRHDDQFILMACDGVFEIMDNFEIMSFLESNIQRLTKEKLVGQQSIQDLLQQLLHKCLALDNKNGYGCDNMTALLILLR